MDTLKLGAENPQENGTAQAHLRYNPPHAVIT
jgi:hypothetical protein